jgi:hypothetical protein
MLSRVLTASGAGRALGTLVCSTVLGLAACAKGDDLGTGPQVPGDPPPNQPFKQAAFIVDVNTSTHEIKITPPTEKINLSSTSLLREMGKNSNLSASAMGIEGPSFSILAGDVVTLVTSNYSASAVGAFTPNKIRVKFDVAIFDKLNGSKLIKPTFPVPPSTPDADGVLLFPFSTNVTTTSGGVAVGGDGTDVIIDLPNTGNVAPSVDWNGNAAEGSGSTPPGAGGDPFNFFNDADCAASGANDCYRFETFTAPIAPQSTSIARTVGFDIDPTVSNFRARLIVAADLADGTASAPGTVAGSVTSPQRGALSGVVVTVTPGSGLTANTDGTGAYSIPNVPVTPSATVALSSLPSGCTNPGSQTTAVSSGTTATVNFTVTCTASVGTVTGSLSRTGPATPSLANVSAVATPGASGTTTSSALLGSASPTTYSIANVLVGSGAGAGSGTVALTNLPAGCTPTPAAATYTGLTSGGSVAATPAFVVDCQAPPAFYQYTSSWGTPSAGSVDLTITFDPTTFNSPNVNGANADDVSQFQADVNYNSSRLTFVQCANAATGANGFTNANAFAATAGTFTVLNFKNTNGTTTFGAKTPVTLAVCTFTINTGAAATVTTSTTLTSLDADGFEGDTQTNLIPNTQKTEASASF